MEQPAFHTRRDVLRLAAGAFGGLVFAHNAHTGGAAPRTAAPGVGAPVLAVTADAPAITRSEVADEAARADLAVAPAGGWQRALLPGTPWETPLEVMHSGVAGSTVLVLGGVHGDEPGTWPAAEEIATWQPRAGTLLVVPRANTLAVLAGARTLPELGDLNRLYPGNPRGLPMAQMAESIVALCREFAVDVLYDMHESWLYYRGRPRNGDAFLGQTITAGRGPESGSIAKALVARVNPSIALRQEQMIARAENPTASARGTNSLAVGLFVPGLTTVLVEMAQDGVEPERRTALQLLVARTFLESRGLV